jgi:hypothetical protein
VRLARRTSPSAARVHAGSSESAEQKTADLVQPNTHVDAHRPAARELVEFARLCAALCPARQPVDPHALPPLANFSEMPPAGLSELNVLDRRPCVVLVLLGRLLMTVF